jgi:GntR family transcriptional regulator/MocR family aminotransferase
VDFHVSLAGRGDLSARIYRQLHEAIIEGRLGPGERLPPTRELAASLSVSRNTVAVAYERLTAEGFLVGRVGAGTFVCANPPSHPPATDRPGGEIPVRPVWRALAADPSPARPVLFDFQVGVPDAHGFPMAAWRRLVARELRDVGVRASGYVDPAGHEGLRAAIARHIGLSRSVRAGADEVVVTHGAQQALDLAGRVLVEPGACVAVEEPGYPPVRELFTSLGAKVAGVPVDGEGLVVAAIPHAASLVYVTPSHQFPLGTAMSLDRRSALLSWAHERGAVVIEDDYDSEFRFSDRPLEPLHSLDRGRRVIYVGSFAKTMLPMLRLGFLVPPPSLRPAIRAAKRLSDRQGEVTTQGAMAAFLTEGLFARHVRRSTRRYAARHERITTILRRDFAHRLDIVPSTAGLHLAAYLREPADVGAIVRRAADAGVVVEDLRTYYGDGPGEPGLALGYGGIELDQIEPGLRRLAACWA